MNPSEANAKRFKNVVFITAASLLILLSVVHYGAALLPFNAWLTLSCVSVVMAVLSLFVFGNVIRANQKSPQRFVSSFTGGLAIKLFAAIIFIGVYLYLKGEDKVLISMATFGVYIIFNVILIHFLLQEIRSKES